MLSKTVILGLILTTGFMQRAAVSPTTQQALEKPAAATAVVPAQPQAASGMSTLYFYRPRLYRGSTVRIGIFVDGTMAVNLVNGRWASIQIPAGHHVIRPKDDQSGIEIDAEPGQSYYFRSGWGEAGLFHNAHKNIMIVMKEQATYEIKQLKPLDDKDVTWPASAAAPAVPVATTNK